MIGRSQDGFFARASAYCYWVVLCVATLGLVSAGSHWATADPVAVPSPSFRCGMSTSIFAGLNENDAKAALRVWMQVLSKERGVRVDPNVKLLEGVHGVRQALVNKQVDGVVVGIDQYWAVRNLLSSRHYVANVTGGDIYENYLVLVHQGSGITNLAGLRRRTVNRFENSEMSLAMPWLDTLFLKQGMPAADSLFGATNTFTKLTQVVLPVFFGRVDACLVTQKGFHVMVELNPQVGKQLRVLASSPKLIATGFFFRAGYPPGLQSTFVSDLEQMNTSASGRQVFTVFHTDRLTERPFSELSRSLQLLDEYHRLQTSGEVLPTPAGSAPTRQTAGP